MQLFWDRANAFSKSDGMQKQTLFPKGKCFLTKAILM